jgi:hypothetical protein
MKFKHSIDEEWLVNQYKTKSGETIAKELGISSCTVLRRLKYLGVAMRQKSTRVKEQGYCSVKGCNVKCVAKGFCKTHYAKFRQRAKHYAWRKRNDTKQNAYQREWNRKHPEKKKIQYDNLKKRQQETKREFVDMMGGSCVICGYNKCLRAMVFHHRDSTQKKFSISGSFLSTKRLRDLCIEELKKCVVMCNRCHEELHSGLITLQGV